MKTEQILHTRNGNGVPDLQDEFARDVLHGLSLSRKSLPCKYIYDKQGSDLFLKIMKLPEYYLTPSETEILTTHGETIGNLIGRQRINLVELGAGCGEKTRILVRELMKKRVELTMIPIDISKRAIDIFTLNMKANMPEIQVKAIKSEYFSGLRWLANQNTRSNMVLFLGSNIGNFEPADRAVFFSSLWNVCNHNDFLLIGFDLKKEIPILLDAYNDTQDITARFNLNLLERINRELGGHFETGKFQYIGTYDSDCGAIKSYLISRCSQTIAIDKLNRSFGFESLESIHTESSYKYLIDDIEVMASENGFSIVQHFFDRRRYFVDSLWQVKKPKK